MMHLLKKQDGVASLVGVTLAGLVMTLLVTAMASMMVGELRRAIDSENGVKAYYAAEGASEEAVAQIISQLSSANGSQPLDTLVGQSCADSPTLHIPTLISGNAFGAVITCREVTTSGRLTDPNLEADNARQVDLSFIQAKTGGIDHVTLTWDAADVQQNANFSEPSIVNGSSTGPVDDLAPPAMEVTSAWYKEGATLDSGIYSKLLIPAPPSAPNSNPINGLTKVTTTPLNNAAASPAARVSCSQQGGRRCKVDLTNLVPSSGTYRSILRIQPRYKAANMVMYFYGADGQEYGVPLDKATVDVTARVGDSFRRVQQTVPIRTTPAPNLNDAIYGDYSVCKDLNILTSPLNNNYLVPIENLCPLNGSSNQN